MTLTDSSDVANGTLWRYLRGADVFVLHRAAGTSIRRETGSRPRQKLRPWRSAYMDAREKRAEGPLRFPGRSGPRGDGASTAPRGEPHSRPASPSLRPSDRGPGPLRSGERATFVLSGARGENLLCSDLGRGAGTSIRRETCSSPAKSSGYGGRHIWIHVESAQRGRCASPGDPDRAGMEPPRRREEAR